MGPDGAGNPPRAAWAFVSGRPGEPKRTQWQPICCFEAGPRSPEWMPLDYCLWDDIERRMLEDTSVNGFESRQQFSARLRRTALRLPRALVRSAIAKMKSNIAETKAAKGKHIKSD